MNRILILESNPFFITAYYNMRGNNCLVFAQTVLSAQKLIEDGGWDIIVFAGQLESPNTNTLQLVTLANSVCADAAIVANDPIWNARLREAGCKFVNRDKDYLFLMIERRLLSA